MAKKNKPETVNEPIVERKKSTPEEKEANHRANIAYSMGRIKHWAKALKHDASSKRYPLDDLDKEKITNALSQFFGQVSDALHPTEEEAQEEAEFSLD